MLSLIDEAAAPIEQLGIRAVGPDGVPAPVSDVQIYSDGGASFHLPPAAERNGHA